MEEEKKKKKVSSWETKRKKKNSVWERKRKRERGKDKILLVFRWSELDSPKTKVGPRNESYTWVPKSEFFMEAPKGRGFLLY